MARILLAQIQQEAENIQWKVLSTEYKNLKEEMEWQCPEGHKVLTPYEKWRKRPFCPVCAEKQKTTTTISSPKPKGAYRILALDQATYITGWAIFENGELIKHGTYGVNFDSEANRINEIRNWVLNMITAWRIDFVCIEDIIKQKEQKAQRQV